MSQTWWTIVPWSERNDQTRPSNARAYEVNSNSPTYLLWAGNNQTPVLIGGQRWTFIEGPFSTQQEAGTAQTQNPGIAARLGVGAAGAITGTTGGASPPGNVLQKSTSAADKAASLNPLHDITQFFTILTERNTWIRVGEVLLGLVLITAGTLKLSEGSGGLAKAAQVATTVNPATGLVKKGLKL